jgi:outer membrane protein TolC
LNLSDMNKLNYTMLEIRNKQVERLIFQKILIGILIALPYMGYSQTSSLQLSLEEVLQLAKEQSPMAIMAKHSFRGSYWEFRTHRAKFLPSLDLSATIPDLSRSIDKITLDDGTDAFVERSQASYSASASLRQNISPTGGNIFMTSSLDRSEQLGQDKINYLSTPISIGFMQPIKAHNSYRWERKIEPMKYEGAKKSYIESIERVNQRAVNYFFNLALAQVNQRIAQLNYSNTDTLYRIAQGRYNIGTIAENELLEMELSFLNAGTALNESMIQLEMNKYQLRSFLGYNETVDIELIIPFEISELDVDVSLALTEARENSPTIVDLKRELLEADKSVAQARSEKGLTASLFASYGLTERAPELRAAYQNTQDQQRLRVGLEVPIVDWGLGKGNYRMAQSNQEVTRTNVRQAEIDFEQEVMLQVMQFNLQDDQLRIASKADTIAQLRYNVTKQRFYIGRIDVIELNIAQRDKDDAARNYLSTLSNYWSYYYNIRRLTLYDFEKMIPLEEDFDALIE